MRERRLRSPTTWPARGLAVRAVVAFVALPGVVGYIIPVLVGWHDRSSGFWSPALALVGASSVLLGWCTVVFYRAGKGTLAPWAPPRELVVSGPYSRSRNPMYIAVLILAVGWALYFRSTRLALYTIVLAVAFHLRVTTYEEPRLAAAFPLHWREYSKRVRRWL